MSHSLIPPTTMSGAVGTHQRAKRPCETDYAEHPVPQNEQTYNAFLVPGLMQSRRDYNQRHKTAPVIGWHTPTAAASEVDLVRDKDLLYTYADPNDRMRDPIVFAAWNGLNEARRIRFAGVASSQGNPSARTAGTSYNASINLPMAVKCSTSVRLHNNGAKTIPAGALVVVGAPHVVQTADGPVNTYPAFEGDRRILPSLTTTDGASHGVTSVYEAMAHAEKHTSFMPLSSMYRYAREKALMDALGTFASNGNAAPTDAEGWTKDVLVIIADLLTLTADSGFSLSVAERREVARYAVLDYTNGGKVIHRLTIALTRCLDEFHSYAMNNLVVGVCIRGSAPNGFIQVRLVTQFIV